MKDGLPIATFRDQIVDAVRKNPVTIITADTGAGKSTQVPQYLLAEGWRLMVTQPRRLAARTVAARVAFEHGTELGGIIGFRTAYERRDSAETKCLFATDGLALVREIIGAGMRDVLVIDEVHEWNLNIEVLVAWSKRQIEAGAKFKVVVMSATLEAQRLAAYFGGAPIISVPGRLHPVEVKSPGGNQLTDVVNLLRQGRNVLWFQPGKSEISASIDALKETPDLSAEIFALHGDLDSSDQDKCFKSYLRPKVVVATNVAQTSITIDDIHAVVDSGVERRIELVDGVEGLYLKPISLADSLQRKGRAGRTKPGVYIDWCNESNRDEYPVAEIMRTRLDQTVLRLAEAGIDMEALDFFHQPDRARIHEAKVSLVALGCMDERGRVTRIGHDVAKLPISVQYARMVVEAVRLHVVDDVITIAAILEQGEITARFVEVAGQKIPAMYTWRRAFCLDERESDVMAQLAVYKAAANMTKDELREKGVFIKAYFQAKERRRHIADALKGKIRSVQSDGDRESILKAVCAGMVDHLWKRTYGSSFKNGGEKIRELARESVLHHAYGAEWVVGLPFDLEIRLRRGGMQKLSLLRMVTKVKPEWLGEIAPQLLKTSEHLNPVFDPMKGEVVSTTEHYFNGVKIREEVVSDPNHPEADRCVVDHLYLTATLPSRSFSMAIDEFGKGAALPKLLELQIGSHPKTGEPLMYYGTYAAETWTSHCAPIWVRDRMEALEAHQRFIATAETYRNNRLEARRRDEEYRAQASIRAAEDAERVEAARLASEKAAEEDRKRRVASVTPDMLSALASRFSKKRA